jgi:hypothetical protein
MPKAVSLRLPAAIPEPIATPASSVIQARVMYSSRNACSIIAARLSVAEDGLAMLIWGTR